MYEQRLQRIFRSLVSCSTLSVLATSACGGSTETGRGKGPVTGSDAGSGGSGGSEAGGGSGGGQSDGGSGGVPGGSGGGGSGGTGGVQPDPVWPELPVNAFVSPCGDGYSPGVDDLNPASPADYVSLRLLDNLSEIDSGVTGDTLEEAGTFCGGASDGGAACEAAVAEAEQSVVITESCGGPPYGCQHYLLTTTADDASAWMPEDYTDFLGEIDTPQEAALLVHRGTFGGYSVCGSAGLGGVRAVEGGYEVLASQMTSDCAPIVTDRILFSVEADGTVTELRRNVASVSAGCVGRRTEALVSCAEERGDVTGDFFASIAHLEAASVQAFRHLHAELAAHGAPSELLEASLSAARDEVRHAETTAGLARKFGGRPTAPSVNPLPVRDLLHMARENAVEGCVRETFGALVATYQSRASKDADVRDAMRAIADDETRHASLAWRIADWLSPALTDVERAAVRAAQAKAISDLRRELDAPVPTELRDLAGVPDRDRALALLDGLRATLWSRETLPA